MGSTAGPPGSRGLRGYAGFFLALTLAVIIAVVFLTPNLMVALAVVGILAQFFIISTQMTLLGDQAAGKHLSPAGLDPRQRATSASSTPPAALAAALAEGFVSVSTAPPGESPPAIVSVPTTQAASFADTVGAPTAPYPGAIDFGGESPLAGGSDEAPAMGFADLNVGPKGPGGALSRDGTPRGNPFDTDRIASRPAAAPCVDDDAIAIYDGDELNAYQVRSRNDPTRVWAGVFRRKALMDRYVREELDEQEDTRWWGRAEN